MQISKNFDADSDNMRCVCCSGLEVAESFIVRMQYLRDLCGWPFILNKQDGFYRCALRNEVIGGALRSRHLLGSAMDVLTYRWVDGHREHWPANKKWFYVSEAMKLGLSLGIYDNFIHTDLRRGEPVLF